MSLKNLVIEGCQFSIEVGGAVIGAGNVSITSPASINSKVKLGVVTKGIYAGQIGVSVSGYTDSAIAGGIGSGVISPSATTMKIDNQAVVLEGDSGQVVLSGTNPQSGSPVSGYTVTVKISVAGQSVVKAE